MVGNIQNDSNPSKNFGSKSYTPRLEIDTVSSKIAKEGECLGLYKLLRDDKSLNGGFCVVCKECAKNADSEPTKTRRQDRRAQSPLVYPRKEISWVGWVIHVS
jgi:hypothetical protein